VTPAASPDGAASRDGPAFRDDIASARSRLRRICLALPQAVEKETWNAPTFRIRDKIFAMVHDVAGRTSVWCKAPPGAQTILVMAAPDRFFRPPYVGQKGWIGFWLDGSPDWEEAADLIARSYQMTAPKRLFGNVASSSRDGGTPQGHSGMATFDWHSGEITRATPVTGSYRNTQKVRRFFQAECGDAFKFDRPFMAWLTDGTPKTMGDAADEWLQRRNVKRRPRP
jgi:predicted DNA-binding protein (MmcQ/YjbR family)